MRRRPVAHVVVTGGAGFVGTNLVSRLAESEADVVVLDDLSRAGVERNLRFLRTTYPGRVGFERGDVRDAEVVRHVLRGADAVFHLAAQVAVTTSLVAPVDDFTVNAEGTLNVLEEVRRLRRRPFLLFTSTNKVYGNLAEIPLRLLDERWLPVEDDPRAHGLGESRPLDFCTPYGCSKGAADQYVLDYAKSFGIPATVFRMSCIYGPHQFGTEDQGWVAHFALRVLQDLPITIYGDGHQVRDILYCDDLVDAMVAAWRNADAVAGTAFNIGGGPANAVSLHDVLSLMGDLHGHLPAVTYEPERTGDQRYYVADSRLFGNTTGWRPSVHPRPGISSLLRWLDREEAPALMQAVAR